MHGFQIDVDALLNFGRYDVNIISTLITKVSNFECKRIEPLINSDKLSENEFDKIFNKVLNNAQYSHITFQNLSIYSSHMICKMISDNQKKNFFPKNAIEWLVKNNQISLKQIPKLIRRIIAAQQVFFYFNS